MLIVRQGRGLSSHTTDSNKATVRTSISWLVSMSCQFPWVRWCAPMSAPLDMHRLIYPSSQKPLVQLRIPSIENPTHTDKFRWCRPPTITKLKAHRPSTPTNVLIMEAPVMILFEKSIANDCMGYIHIQNWPFVSSCLYFKEAYNLLIPKHVRYSSRYSSYIFSTSRSRSRKLFRFRTDCGE